MSEKWDKIPYFFSKGFYFMDCLIKDIQYCMTTCNPEKHSCEFCSITRSHEILEAYCYEFDKYVSIKRINDAIPNLEVKLEQMIKRS